MQQTKSYWRLVAVAGIVSAFVASACVVTTDPDDGAAGAAGSGKAGAGAGTAGAGTAGAGTAGAGTAGAGTAGAGTAGTGGSGAVPFQCDPGEGGAQGTPNSCTPVDADDPCQKCIQAKCCSEFEMCYATSPGNQCGWGGPLEIDGKPNGGGEAACVQLCLQKAVTESGVAPEASEVQACAANCATVPSNGASKDCGSTVGYQTSDLVECLLRDCSVTCFGA